MPLVKDAGNVLEPKIHFSVTPIHKKGIPYMKIRAPLIFIPAVLFPMAAYSQTAASENADAPEIDACRASGLIALKERSPTIKDVELDLDSVRVIKMNSKIGGVDIKAMVLGDASIEKKTSSKAKNLICILGEKGKVLLTVFSDQ
jgi:hypothetical protein